MPKLSIALSFPLVAVLGACASYSARSVPILAPDTYGHQQTVNGVTLVADVYGTEAKYRSVFDTAPSYERGYLGINLLVFNDAATAVAIDPANVACLATNGSELTPIPAEQVAEQVLRSTTGRYIAGGIIAAGSSRGANDRIRADFAAKALRSQEVPAGGRNQGFVFCPNAVKLERLVVRGLRHGDGEVSSVDIQLPDTPLSKQ